MDQLASRRRCGSIEAAGYDLSSAPIQT